MTALLEARGLCKTYRLPGGGTRVALRDVDLALAPGETVGVVGASGSGKTTLARLLLALERPDAGSVWLDGIDLASLSRARLRRLRPRFQPVFQDPGAALDPRWRVRDSLLEAATVRGPLAAAARRDAVLRALADVGLDPALALRYPHELSGGERQRVAVARALAVEPAVLVADEPLAHLDPAARAELVDLLARIGRLRGLALLLVSHDLDAVASACERLIVLDAGCVVESGEAARVLREPASAAARALMCGGVAPCQPGIDGQTFGLV